MFEAVYPAQRPHPAQSRPRPMRDIEFARFPERSTTHGDSCQLSGTCVIAPFHVELNGRQRMIHGQREIWLLIREGNIPSTVEPISLGG